jgi:hypothetical protein
MRKFILFILAVTLCHLVTSVALAESLSVSLRVGETRVEFTGYTSPSAFIVIKQNDAVISTTVADANGNFTQIVDAYNPGIQSFAISSRDTTGLTTPTLTYNINLLDNTVTTIGNIVFPPTVSLNPLTNLVSGSTYPLASLSLFVNNASYSVPVATDGSWTYDLTSIGLSSGAYSTYLIATIPGGHLSSASTTISFTIATPPPSQTPSINVTTPSTTPTPSLSPSPSPSLSPAERALVAILNIFTPDLDLPLISTNLAPIVERWIAFWQISTSPKLAITSDSHLPPGSCDFDGDKNCDLVDLSILLYYIKP